MGDQGLRWPQGRPRTAAGSRRYGRFSTSKTTEGGWRRSDSITVAQALSRLEDELQRLGARYSNLTHDMERRLDGAPRSGAKEPADPGVAVYFDLKGDEIALACDTYTSVAQNIAALAAHIEATRKIERHGVASAREMFHAFLALPAPGVKRSCWDILGLSPTADREAIKAAFRRRAKNLHSDHGGSDDAMAELNVAYQEALRDGS